MEHITTFFFISILLLIFYQDMKERKVYLLFFSLGIFSGSLIYYQNSFLTLFLINIGINISVIALISLLLILYIKIILKKKILEAIGLGDFLFFILLALSFPMASFLILFSLSLIFSLLLFLILKPNLKNKTIPLAGLQAFFVSLVLIINWFFNFVDIYAL